MKLKCRIASLTLASLCLATVAGASAQVVSQTIANDPVTIDSGKVAGKMLASGVKAYFGLPYAAAPVTDLRWREPQAVPRWDGVYNADRKGPECIQLLRRKDINHYFGEEATSEDCLYMNIWAPGKAAAGAKLPVVVFIHGGGFTLGSSGMALYGGENVAAKGAVFVNFNYRLGILGFMAHPELTAESGRHASGNYGFLDQIAALRWIQRNITKFGGDPAKVTISGQSAGAASVIALVASPLGKGLFQRAVAMSGSDINNDQQPLAESEKAGLDVQKVLGAKSIAEMRQLPADKIFVVQRDFQFGESGTVAVKPNVDGYFMPDTMRNIFAAGKQNDVPMISGFTHDDISISPLRSVQSLAQFQAKAADIYGDKASRFLSLYPATTDAEAIAMGKLSAREAMMEKGSRNLGKAYGRTGKAPFYMYVFSRVHPFNPAVKVADNPQGAYHTSDVPYWFQTQEALNMFRKTRLWDAAEQDMSARMLDSLLAFARTGNPATQATAWPQWTTANPQFINFGERVTLQAENTERMDFQDIPVQFIPAGTVQPRLTRD